MFFALNLKQSITKLQAIAKAFYDEILIPTNSTSQGVLLNTVEQPSEFCMAIFLWMYFDGQILDKNSSFSKPKQITCKSYDFNLIKCTFEENDDYEWKSQGMYLKILNVKFHMFS